MKNGQDKAPEGVSPDITQCRKKLKIQFPDLSENELSRLIPTDSVKYYKKGTVVYEEGTKIKGCYFIYSGILKIYQTGTGGKEQIIKFEQGGDLFGFRSVISCEPACTSIKTLSDAVLCYIPGTALLSLLKSNFGFAYEILQLACKELGESNRYIRDIAQKSVKKRLAEILVMIAEDFGLENDSILKLNPTREDLSNFAGTATETIIRLLSELKNEGLIELQGRKIKLLDIGKLKIIADRS